MHWAATTRQNGRRPVETVKYTSFVCGRRLTPIFLQYFNVIRILGDNFLFHFLTTHGFFPSNLRVVCVAVFCCSINSICCVSARSVCVCDDDYAFWTIFLLFLSLLIV